MCEEHFVLKVVIVTCICVGYIVFGCGVIYPWFGVFSFKFVFNWAVASFLVFSLLFNYWKACKIKSFVDLNWSATDSTEYPLIGKKTSQSDKYTFCSKCNADKPPRAQHCYTCKRCILKYDHHCPFFGNCIAFNNHKFFINFLFYVLLTASYVVVIVGIRFYFLYSNVIFFLTEIDQQIKKKNYYCLATLFATVPLATITIPLFQWQLWLISKNILTYEFEDYLRLKKESNHSKNWKYPYDLGTFKNFQLALGTNWKYWFLPTDFQFKKKNNEIPGTFFSTTISQIVDC